MRYCSCLSDTHPCPGSEVTQKPCPSNGRVFPFRLSHDRHNRQEGRAGLPVLSLDQGHVDRVWSVCATDRVFERASEGEENLNPAPKRQGSFIAAYNRSKRSTDVGCPPALVGWLRTGRGSAPNDWFDTPDGITRGDTKFVSAPPGLCRPGRHLALLSGDNDHAQE
jgi:hypothetical protein